MSLFSSSKPSHWVGIFSILDPAMSKDQPRFSPPFFSTADDVACQALLETLRRKTSSYEELYQSLFLRMELWRLGSVDLDEGKIFKRAQHRYKVVSVRDYLDRDYVKHYMRSVPYGAEVEK